MGPIAKKTDWTYFEPDLVKMQVFEPHLNPSFVAKTLFLLTTAVSCKQITSGAISSANRLSICNRARIEFIFQVASRMREPLNQFWTLFWVGKYSSIPMESAVKYTENQSLHN